MQANDSLGSQLYERCVYRKQRGFLEYGAGITLPIAALDIFDGLWASSTNFNKEVAYIEEDRRTEKSRERPSYEMGVKVNISREE